MKKYKYDGIAIEVTRRCNMKCEHCMRGDAQNVTMTQEIIDSIIKNVAECKKFFITGGEPLLAIDMIEYLVTSILNSGIKTSYIELTTNGTILDSRIISVLAHFCKSNDKRKAVLRISNDPFHDVHQSEKAYTYYQSLSNDESGISVRYSLDEHNGKMPELRLSGRGVQFRDRKNIIKFTESKRIDITPMAFTNHRAKIVDETIKCTINIAANGNVGFLDEQDYEMSDNLSFGNILKNSIYDLINKNNSECLLSCLDSAILDVATNWDSITYNFKYPLLFASPEMDSIFVKIANRICSVLCQRVMNVREDAHTLYPHIPTYHLIELLPFPDLYSDATSTTLKNILDDSESVSNEEISEYIDDETIKTVNLVIKMAKERTLKSTLFQRQIEDTYSSLMDALKVLFLINKPNARLAISEIYGSGDYHLKKRFLDLEAIDRKYSTGELQINNMTNSECTMEQIQKTERGQ